MKGQAEEEVDQLLKASNGGPKIVVDRTVFSQKHFDENFESGLRPSPTLRKILKKKVSKCVCSMPCLKGFLITLFPFINILKNYNIRTDLPGDIVSGLTVGIMHIPQGLAYGMLTTLPPIYGLYMSFFPVLVYFFFGSSRHVSMGTFAVVCLMVGTSVTKGFNALQHTLPVDTSFVNNSNDNVTQVSYKEVMSHAELELKVQLAMSVTFMAGVLQLFMGIFRLGFVTAYLSDALISGFTTGAAVHVFTSQIKQVFSVKTARYSGALKLVYTYRDFFVNIKYTNYMTVVLSVVTMAILYCVTRFINQNPKLKPKMFMPVPIELIIVVLGTVISYVAKLEENFKVDVVSDLPTGLPMPSLHCLSQIQFVIADAIALAIVVFAISISMGKLLAKKHNYEVDANQELVAIGLSTIIPSFFSTSAPSASLSRSLIQETVGGKTQVAGLVSCCLLLVVLLVLGPYFRTLPNCVLASIIIVALRGMFLQFLDLKTLWKISLIEFFVWIVAFVATVLLDVELGLLAAVVFNLLTVIGRSQRPYVTLLGRIKSTELYRDIDVCHEAKEIPGVKIVSFEHSVFFVNTENFRNQLYKKTVNPRMLKIAHKKRNTKILKQQQQDPIFISGDECISDVHISANAFDAELLVTSNIKDINVVYWAEKQKQRCPPDLDFHTIILDCSPWNFIDSMGIKVLTAIVMDYQEVGVQVFLANCRASIHEMFQKSKFYKMLDHSHIFVSIYDAVEEALHPQQPAVELKAKENLNSADYMSEEDNIHSVTVEVDSSNGASDSIPLEICSRNGGPSC